MRLVPLLALALPGCAAQEACADMCEAAETRIGGCLEDQGIAWTDVGWQDPADFRAFCATWMEEARALGELDRCPEMTKLLEEGSCADWPGVFLGGG